MPKPLPAILLAVLANVLLLAHSVIPHHHHGGEVCFEVGHCTACEAAHTGECALDHKSDPPADQDDSCCVLDQMVIFHPDKVKDKMEAARKPAELDFQQDFSSALIPGHFSFTHFAFHLPFRQNPPEPSYPNACVSQSLGLRAPPLV